MAPTKRHSAAAAAAAQPTEGRSLTDRLVRRRAGDDALKPHEVQRGLYWARQGAACALGLLLGTVPVTGNLGNVVFALLVGGGVHAALITRNDLDEDEHGGTVKLLFEGMGTAYACFLLLWLMAFSVLHPDQASIS